MAENLEQIKAVLDELSTSDLPVSARMVAVLFELGIEEPKELERMMGLRPSSARQAKRQLKDYRCNNSAAEQRDEITARCDSAAMPEQRGVTAPPRAHAYKESPSEIVIPKEMLASSAHACEEIDGLNGSTSTFVGWLATWLNEWAPDHDTARELLASNCACYGPKQVMAGMIDLKTQIAAGQKPRNLVKSFSGFIRNASTEPKPSAKVVQATAFSEALARRMARKEAANG